MKSDATWAVVMPAHNSAHSIRQSIEDLCEYFQTNRIKGQVVVVENGSTDSTWDVLNSINDSLLPFDLVVVQSMKGLGNAIREGMRHVSVEWVLVTADDLPFGFSDLDEFRKLSSWPDAAVGSKAHPDTAGNRSFARKIMSLVFRNVRRCLTGVNLGDTQGSILGKSTVLRQLSDSTRQPGYLMTTELLTLAHREKLEILELPVVFREELRKSNVKPIRDSVVMIKGLFEIRQSLK